MVCKENIKTMRWWKSFENYCIIKLAEDSIYSICIYRCIYTYNSNIKTFSAIVSIYEILVKSTVRVPLLIFI